MIIQYFNTNRRNNRNNRGINEIILYFNSLSVPLKFVPRATFGTRAVGCLPLFKRFGRFTTPKTFYTKFAVLAVKMKL